MRNPGTATPCRSSATTPTLAGETLEQGQTGSSLRRLTGTLLISKSVARAVRYGIKQSGATALAQLIPVAIPEVRASTSIAPAQAAVNRSFRIRSLNRGCEESG